MNRKNHWSGRSICVLLLLALLIGLTGCHKADSGKTTHTISTALHYTDSMDVKYAEKFTIDYYEEGPALLTINGEQRFLVVPEDRADAVPADLPEDITVLQQPLTKLYTVASACMDMFVAVDALDCVRFSGLNASDWSLPEVQEAMEDGSIRYAGKYSAPDYEQLLDHGCSLAIENTMIYHKPEVLDQLKKLGIPAMVEYSSYESDPRGRMEWVRVFGLLTGRQEAAEAAFTKRLNEMDAVEKAVADADSESGKEAGRPSVVFFYRLPNGEIKVRRSSDYIPKLIHMAGGRYVLEDLEPSEDTAMSTITMQMEDLYASAKDVDYIIYNSTIAGEVHRISELTDAEPLLKKFKAVKTGNVFCTTADLYQSSMELSTFLTDLHDMLNGETDGMTFLYQLN